MPTYQYKCNNCDHYFEIVQSMKDKKKRKCPECKKLKLQRLLGQPMIFVKGDPSTIGHWAERNTENMGRYEIGDKRGQQEVKRYFKDFNSNSRKQRKTKCSII